MMSGNVMNAERRRRVIGDTRLNVDEHSDCGLVTSLDSVFASMCECDGMAFRQGFYEIEIAA